MYFTDSAMEKVLSGCPNLECLKLYYFWGLRRLEINNVKLKKLIMDNSEANECDEWLEIVAPYIQNLQVLGLYCGICLRNVDSLVTTVLDFEFDFDFGDEDSLRRKEYTCLKEFLHNVAHVKNLELGPWCIQCLSVLELEGWQPPPSNWKFLRLNTNREKSNFLAICSFLQSSSHLETLVIDWHRYQLSDLLSKYINEDGQIRRVATHSYNCSLLHLKTIKFINFFSPHSKNKSGPSLVKYLLKHATVLEKFTIATRFRKRDVSRHYVKIERELLSFPRSSPHASVIFSYR